jgi:hypothetical protein
MHGESIEQFEVSRGSFWEVRLREPVRKVGRLVAGLLDENGCNCLVFCTVSDKDPRRVIIATRSGLSTRGTITVGYSYVESALTPAR